MKLKWESGFLFGHYWHAKFKRYEFSAERDKENLKTGAWRVLLVIDDWEVVRIIGAKTRDQGAMACLVARGINYQK